MTTYHGKNGTVYVGANAVGEITEFTINEEATVADDSAIGDTADTHIAGEYTTRWTASITTWWDPDDTNGQEALTVGASVTFNGYPEGNSANDVYYTGTGTVTGVQIGPVNRNGTVVRSITLQGNGALTRSTV